ncbi:MAG: Ku protein [Cellulomonadaceae bacterium]|jgi:DNA end-binding protein Ku|nr:Ku protein [Cellulomonadaceae bacterium]
MHSIWKGAVSFGLVNVPVKLYAATENHDLALHQVHARDGGRIRYQKVCSLDGEVVPQSEIIKGFYDGHQIVTLNIDDLSELPAERSREIEVVEFVPSDQIDPIMFDSTYYLEPDSKSAKAYVLLRRVLTETNRTAIVKFAIRDKSHLAVLRVRDEVLVLQTLLWPDEVRKPDFPALEGVKVSDREIEMAKTLVTSFEADFNPGQYQDDYQNQLRELIDRKIADGDGVTAKQAFASSGTADDDAGVTDLMTALRKSVEAAKAKTAPKPKKKP